MPKEIPKRGGRVTGYNANAVRDVSVKVYKLRLGPGEAEAMIAKDGDNGERLRARAACYDELTRVYFKAIYG